MALLLLFLLLLPQSVPTTSNPLSQLCEENGKYTTNSTFQSNLNLFLPSLSSNASISGFSTASYGQIPDRVYGLAQCRADSNSSECGPCLSAAAQDIVQLCQFSKRAVIWYDFCLLHYADEQFFSSVDNSNLVPISENRNVTNPNQFDELVKELMDRISQWAAYNSSIMFATGRLFYGWDFPAIYGMVECTRDLSGIGCNQCLQQILIELPDCCEGKRGGRVLAKSCNFRYEVYSFFEQKPTILINVPTSAEAGSPSPLFSPKGKGNNVTGVVLAIVIPLVTALVLITIICVFFWRRRAIKIPKETDPEEITSVESLLFDLSTLRTATINFSDENKLGQGGFGAVYKGTLPDGREIAVKRLLASSTQGLGELKNELVLVAKLQHRNLVRLLGVCLEEQEKLLVYEYVPNRSLDTILFDPNRREQLYWERRYKIIGGIARGLLYLHEDSQHKIIHRDLKASNILLDADMNPKISDFGMARLFGRDQTQGTTRRIVGTFGYMAPEYAMRGNFSMKSDVFSFGVLVLEIVTGKRNSGFFYSEQAEDLLNYAWEHWINGTIREIIDPSLGDHFPRSEVLRCVQIALLCAQKDPAERPTMSTVVVLLNSYSVSLQAPSRPAFCIGKTGMDSNLPLKESELDSSTAERSSSKSIPMSPNEVTVTELEPR